MPETGASRSPWTRRRPPSSCGAAPRDDGRKDQVAAWNAKYPNLKLTFGTQHNTTTQGEASFAPIIAAAAAGVPPTVVDFDRFQVAAMALKRLWIPLDDFIKRDKYDMNRFAPLVVPEAKGPDGKWYAMIRSADDRLLFWNKELFQESGLDPEKPPTTWDELRQFAIRLTKRGAGPGGLDRIGFNSEYGQSHYHIYAWQNGGIFQSPDGKKATLPDGKNQEALQWMADLIKDIGGWQNIEAFRTAGPAGSWGTNAQEPFLVNQLAMVYQTNSNIPSAVARFRPDMKFGFAQPPLRKAGDKPLTWSGGHSYCISTGAKDADIGWELCKWLISEEGITALYDGNLGRARGHRGRLRPAHERAARAGQEDVRQVPDRERQRGQGGGLRCGLDAVLAGARAFDRLAGAVGRGQGVPDSGRFAGQERQAGPGRQSDPGPEGPRRSVGQRPHQVRGAGATPLQEKMKSPLLPEAGARLRAAGVGG